jgi:phenylacetate-CoA ligase
MELGTIALQCPESENLHVQAEFVLLEVLDAAGRPCRPGETGRVVVTALHNFATPLIRYALGDYATVAGPCACGCGLPALSRVVGRQRNLLIYPNGQRIFPEARPGGLVEVAPIVQFQLVQPSVERLVFRVVPGRPWTAAEEAALRLFLRDKFRHPFQIDIEYLAELPRQPNGKFDEFISHVAPAAAARRAVD